MPLIFTIGPNPSPTSVVEGGGFKRKAPQEVTNCSNINKLFDQAMKHLNCPSDGCPNIKRMVLELLYESSESKKLFPLDSNRFSDEVASDLRALDTFINYLDGDESTNPFFKEEVLSNPFFSEEEMKDAVDQLGISENYFNVDHEFEGKDLSEIDELKINPEEMEGIIFKLLEDNQ